MARRNILKKLDELRKRFIRGAVVLLVAFGLCYAFAEQLFAYLAKPLTDVLPTGSHLVLVQITEGFMTYLKLGFWGGVFLASPYLLFEIWSFLGPLMKTRTRWGLFVTVTASYGLFIAGTAFGYYVFLPLAMQFFVSYVQDMIVGNFPIGFYLSFVVWSLLAFGVVFQLPLVLLLLNRLGIVYAPRLKRFRRYALLLAFVVGALITPTPDAFNQIVISFPIYLFYELSIWLIVLFGRRPPVVEEA